MVMRIDNDVSNDEDDDHRLLYSICDSRSSIHFLKGNDTRNTPIVLTYCCNNQEFLRKSQKQILIYCLKERKQYRESMNTDDDDDNDHNNSNCEEISP